MSMEEDPTEETPTNETTSTDNVCIKEVRAYCVEQEDAPGIQTVLSHHHDDAFVVQVELNNGLMGIGVSHGGDAACYIVEKQLAPVVEGQDPSNVEGIWDNMFHVASKLYGRHGVAIHAISAIDLAIWDVLGKVRELPVYALLGGKTKDKLKVYATTLRPDVAKRMGFDAAKIPLPYEPSAGALGLSQNIQLIRAQRHAVGPDYGLMIECTKNPLAVPFVIELTRKISDCNIQWIEEALSPTSSLEGYARLSEKVPTMLWVLGKRKYTRYDFQQVLKQTSSDILSLDVTTCGGLTEARKIVAMVSAHDISVIPHGSVYGYHLQMASSNCPLSEYIMLKNPANNNEALKSYFYSILDGEPVPSNGYISLEDDKPGFGIELCSNSTEWLKRHPHIRDRVTYRQMAAAPNPVVAQGTSAATASVAAAPAAVATIPPNFPPQLLLKPPPPPPPQRGVQTKAIPAKRGTKLSYKAPAIPYHPPRNTRTTMHPVATAAALAAAAAAPQPPVGFRRYISMDNVDKMSFADLGDWCRKVGIPLKGTKKERLARLKEYLKLKKPGHREY